MATFRAEPFLWIHLAGIAVVPAALLLMACGLAVGTPFTPYGLELILLVAIAWLPMMAMQWFRPFEIFSVLILAIRPGSLTTSQRQILTLFKQAKQRWVTLFSGFLSLALLWFVYLYSPLVYDLVDDLPPLRLLGLTIAAIAYLLVNLFLQVPLSVLGVLFTPQSTYKLSAPIDPDSIPQSFTVPGIKVRQIPLIPTLESNSG
ncbi:MAG: low-complexity tail membrane protein [Synechocystis sp.]